jgi:hypothetical protein
VAVRRAPYHAGKPAVVLFLARGRSARRNCSASSNDVVANKGRRTDHMQAFCGETKHGHGRLRAHPPPTIMATLARPPPSGLPTKVHAIAPNRTYVSPATAPSAAC